jgi:tetratricopeptide (TPR) repeat protein
MEPTRPGMGRWLDRFLTPLLALVNKSLGRPSEEDLATLTGRARGGAEPAPVASALEEGRRELQEGRFAEALFHFGRATTLNPDDPWSHHGRGDALQLAGDPEAALKAYDSALERDPHLAISHSGRGNALESLGRHEEAIAAWQCALERDQDLAWARAGLERHGAL